MLGVSCNAVRCNNAEYPGLVTSPRYMGGLCVSRQMLFVKILSTIVKYFKIFSVVGYFPPLMIAYDIFNDAYHLLEEAILN